MADDEVNVRVLRIDAASLVELETRRNKLLKDELELEKNGRQILSGLKSDANTNLLCNAALGFSMGQLMPYFHQVLLLLTFNVFTFAVQFIGSIAQAKIRLNRLNDTRRYFIAQQRILAREVEVELDRLNINENVEEILEGGPLISLRSFVARAQCVSGTNEFDKIYTEMNSFMWKKFFHCFLVMLLTSLIIVWVSPKSQGA